MGIYYYPIIFNAITSAFEQRTMKCIFCKKEASNSMSIEHIVPESLGNKNNVLPKGAVCDKCNNYFALKIEKKVLETKFFTSLRHRNGIESKKRKIPKGKVIISNRECEAEVFKDKNKPIEIKLDTDSFNMIAEGKIKHFILPLNNKIPENDLYISRLLAKIGLEMLALRVIENYSKEQNLFATETQLEPIREYARFNSKNENWIYHSRKIYEEDEKFYLENGDSFDMVFECDFLATKEMEIYFIIAFKGIEFVINMAGSCLDGYKKWLIENNEISPLYSKGSHFGYNLTPKFMINN